MNMIMAAVAILVMLKTMVNGAIRNQKEERFETEEDDFNETPGQASDLEYEYLNDLLGNEDFDLSQFKIEDFENLNFQKMMLELNDNLEFKLAIMKNSTVLNELLLKNGDDNNFEAGEAVSDS